MGNGGRNIDRTIMVVSSGIPQFPISCDQLVLFLYRQQSAKDRQMSVVKEKKKVKIMMNQIDL